MEDLRVEREEHVGAAIGERERERDSHSSLICSFVIRCLSI